MGTLLWLTLERLCTPTCKVFCLWALFLDTTVKILDQLLFETSCILRPSLIQFLLYAFRKQSKSRGKEGLVATSFWLHETRPELVAHLVILSIHKLPLRRPL